MKKLHDQIWAQIKKVNASYKARANKHWKPKVFNLRDLVWLHWSKKRFPFGRKNKLMAQGEDPFKVLEWIVDIAYNLEQLGDMNVSSTFNVGN